MDPETVIPHIQNFPREDLAGTFGTRFDDDSTGEEGEFYVQSELEWVVSIRDGPTLINSRVGSLTLLANDVQVGPPIGCLMRAPWSHVLPMRAQIWGRKGDDWKVASLKAVDDERWLLLLEYVAPGFVCDRSASAIVNVVTGVVENVTFPGHTSWVVVEPGRLSTSWALSQRKRIAQVPLWSSDEGQC